MNKQHSAAFLLEYLAVILFFSLASAVTGRIYAISYLRNDLANRKRECLPYVNAYIETGVYEAGTFMLDDDFERCEDGVYTVTVSLAETPYEHYTISVYYKDETLIQVPFYGGRS